MINVSCRENGHVVYAQQRRYLRSPMKRDEPVNRERREEGASCNIRLLCWSLMWYITCLVMDFTCNQSKKKHRPRTVQVPACVLRHAFGIPLDQSVGPRDTEEAESGVDSRR